MLIFEYFCGLGFDFFLMSSMGLYRDVFFFVLGGRVIELGVVFGIVYVLLIVFERFIEVVYVGELYIVFNFLFNL